MKGYKLEFNVYAESEEEVDEATETIKKFIASYAAEGIAITAAKINKAVAQWGRNAFVKNFFK